MSGKKIRLGLLLDSLEIPAWQYRLLEEILKLDYASIQLLIMSGTQAATHSIKSKKSFLYDAFCRYEKKKHLIFPDACEIKNADGLIGDIERVSPPANSTNTCSPRSAETPDPVRSRQLDIILAIGGLDSVGALDDASKYGVCYFEHDFGQIDPADGTSVGFWEVVKRRPFISSAVVIQHADLSSNYLAYRTFSGINYRSHRKSRNEHLWKISSLVPRTLRLIHTSGEHHFLEKLKGKTSNSQAHRRTLSTQMTNSALTLPLAKHILWHLFSKVTRKLYTERWIVLFDLGGKSTTLKKYRKLVPPQGRFWADPHVLRRDQCYYVFIEDASLNSHRGHISIIRINDDGECSPPTKIIAHPYHLSYPFIFEWENNLYLIPESAENRTIDVYRCKQFPYEWEYYRNLMNDVSAYDTTLFAYDGVWWMFTNIKEHDGASSWDELFLFYSDNPLSTHWHPHPLNPIISDVRRARPAGKLFEENGRVYRPSQNSAYRYGHGLNINEVLELTKTTYREQVVKSFEPGWDRSVKGIHSYSRVNDLTVIDAIHRSSNFRFTRIFKT